ncbi:MAG: hypothetical protein KGL90_15000 [Burkholderiales bacterium]|nr:hypothetical protein [Burkholderiales bacterium]
MAKNVRRWAGLLCLGVLMSLTGCDQLGIETPQKAKERDEAEAKAVGSACRHAVRAIEDCYVLNPKAEKSAVFAGWREMDEYMRENKLEGVAPVIPRPVALTAAASKPSAAGSEPDDEEADAASGEPPQRKTGKSSVQ